MSWLFGKKATEERREPWQIAIDEDKKRKEEEEQAHRLLDEQKRQEEYQKNVQKLGEIFKCHCCSKPSTIPGKKDLSQTSDDWNTPGDLYVCEHCGLWTCMSCFYRGICKDCGLKMVSKH